LRQSFAKNKYGQGRIADAMGSHEFVVYLGARRVVRNFADHDECCDLLDAEQGYEVAPETDAGC